MNEKIFNIIAGNGVWAVLFFMLLVVQIKDSRARERKYQETISKLSQSLEVVKEINDGMREARKTLCKLLEFNAKATSKAVV